MPPKSDAPPKRGRPSTGGRDPIRSVRIDDETWAVIQQGAVAANLPVSELVRDASLARAKREIAKVGKA